uniref:Uncharacterized protein n=1 Tax=Timema bartmani TaxID=61472 RepID=A0A7R9EXK7_9NEOP|nr:unnamed protein product [Timema bartmani]
MEVPTSVTDLILGVMDPGEEGAARQSQVFPYDLHSLQDMDNLRFRTINFNCNIHIPLLLNLQLLQLALETA